MGMKSERVYGPARAAGGFFACLIGLAVFLGLMAVCSPARAEESAPYIPPVLSPGDLGGSSRPERQTIAVSRGELGAFLLLSVGLTTMVVDLFPTVGFYTAEIPAGTERPDFPGYLMASWVAGAVITVVGLITWLAVSFRPSPRHGPRRISPGPRSPIHPVPARPPSHPAPARPLERSEVLRVLLFQLRPGVRECLAALPSAPSSPSVAIRMQVNGDGRAVYLGTDPEPSPALAECFRGVVGTLRFRASGAAPITVLSPPYPAGEPAPSVGAQQEGP
jgi:hypothetical protein